MGREGWLCRGVGGKGEWQQEREGERQDKDETGERHGVRTEIAGRLEARWRMKKNYAKRLSRIC